MSINTFMNKNLDLIRDEIIKNIPNKEFDSHEFIRHFARRFEMDYVTFLNKYPKEPFRNVHSQIGRFLSDKQVQLFIQENGSTISSNIFGDSTSNESWIKTK